MADYGFKENNSEDITFVGSGGGVEYKYDPTSHTNSLTPSGQGKQLVGYGQGGGYWTDSNINFYHSGATDKIVGGAKTVGRWYLDSFYVKPYNWVRGKIKPSSGYTFKQTYGRYWNK